jgi:hypothetical protein
MYAVNHELIHCRQTPEEYSAIIEQWCLGKIMSGQNTDIKVVSGY